MKNLQLNGPAEYDAYSNMWECQLVDTAGRIMQIATGITKLEAENAAILIVSAWDLREALEVANDADGDIKKDGGDGFNASIKIKIEKALIKAGVKL